MENELKKIEGTVEEIIYNNSENGYTVLYLDVISDIVVAAGIMPLISEGESVCIYGNWSEHPKYGQQFTALYYEPKIEHTEEFALKYLSSGIIKGIGPSTAKKIVEKFGDKTFYIIENDCEKLVSIKGITALKATLIHREYMKKTDLQNIVSFFSKYDVSGNIAIKIYNTFGKASIELSKKNPYILCEQVDTIGFLTADKIAKKMGFDDNSPQRICAGVIYTLNSEALNGHTCLKKDMLTDKASHFLSTSYENTENGITQLIAQGKLVLKDNIISLPIYYEAENYIASRIRALKKIKTEDLSKKINIDNYTDIELAELQKEAVSEALRNNLLIITGGPGTGKTTVIKTIISIFRDMKKKVVLTAPTGRAAKRISELTSNDAKTIHRLLEINFSKENKTEFSKNAQNPLECDVIIIDEMSMTDVLLFQALLNALRENARIIMVGDCDQLPSVGAGNVLKDLISSEQIKRITFDEIFRQNNDSQIIINAHRILKGNEPVYNKENSDFFFVSSTNTQDAKEKTKELLMTRLPKFLNTIPDKIQVLTPMRKTALGSKELNKTIKDVINPINKSDITKNTKDFVFSVGDRVMQTKNDYDITWENNTETGTGIYNGDMGIITAIDLKHSEMTILFDDDKKVYYDFSKLDNLELAYAITVHKSQGSEFDAIIIPLLYGYDQLMTRNLLYTAVTRAKKFVCIVGDKNCVMKMINNDIELKRYTMLENYMKNEKGI